MLVLTQSTYDGPIHIEVNGEHIEIHLLGVRKDQARYGFSANKNVKINRDVIFQKIQREGDNRDN